jgi:hypothetical protein
VLPESGRHRRQPGQKCRPFGSTPQSLGEGADEFSRRWDKTIVEVEKAQKCLQLLHCRRPGEFSNGLHPGQQGPYTSGAEAEAEKINGRAGEQTLVQVDDEAILLEQQRRPRDAASSELATRMSSR